MSNYVDLGGGRIGSGNRMKVELQGFKRSTHDLSYIFRNTQAAGTLVPFGVIPVLPGDTIDINFDANVRTLPTIAPLFGSFKLQIDSYFCPIRLYNGLLHNNKIGIGLNMSQVKLPLIDIVCKGLDLNSTVPLEFQQINQSSLLAYLGIRGVGKSDNNKIKRYFNAVPLVAYWDIYKNYYANKQEEIGCVLEQDTLPSPVLSRITYDWGQNFQEVTLPFLLPQNKEIAFYGPKGYFDFFQILDESSNWTSVDNFFNYVDIINDDEFTDIAICRNIDSDVRIMGYRFTAGIGSENDLVVKTFDLNVIDDMRNTILNHTANTPVFIDKVSPRPYNSCLTHDVNYNLFAINSQQGLGLKTYQSDIFNNWLNTEYLDGDSGINAITAISTEGDKFTLDSFNLSKKVYDMLNRIAVSGGTYNDWLEAAYDVKGISNFETPMYLGGMSQEIVFQEVVSTAESKIDGNTNSLGTLAGKGILLDNRKGGYVRLKAQELGYIINIVSITPRVDYYQGNSWDSGLFSVDDFHKPSLSGIGFQDLITEKMAFWDNERQQDEYSVGLKSAGKQPAWLDYMTNFNKLYGNFADQRKEMYMTLARRYSPDNNGNIADLTTYIDPAKFNYCFAQNSRDAMNFWVQIASNIQARRVMSAKIIPNI